MEEQRLENAGELLKKFEKEYGKDDRKVRKQERIGDEGDYCRGEFPGRYTTRKLFGWSDGEYDRKYWQRLEKNWRQWKKIELAEGRKGSVRLLEGWC